MTSRGKSNQTRRCSTFCDRFGASALGDALLREYGFTVENVRMRALAMLRSVRKQFRSDDRTNRQPNSDAHDASFAAFTEATSTPRSVARRRPCYTTHPS
jgi:hypothetical protein